MKTKKVLCYGVYTIAKLGASAVAFDYEVLRIIGIEQRCCCSPLRGCGGGDARPRLYLGLYTNRVTNYFPRKVKNVEDKL